MPGYVVQRGDTLWRIARNHGIRYRPNVYFATQKEKGQEKDRKKGQANNALQSMRSKDVDYLERAVGFTARP